MSCFNLETTLQCLYQGSPALSLCNPMLRIVYTNVVSRWNKAWGQRNQHLNNRRVNFAHSRKTLCLQLYLKEDVPSLGLRKCGKGARRVCRQKGHCLEALAGERGFLHTLDLRWVCVYRKEFPPLLSVQGWGGCLWSGEGGSRRELTGAVVPDFDNYWPQF